MPNYQTIHEKIAVIGIYEKTHFFPKKFAWRSRTLQIQEITTIVDMRDGQARLRMYSVVCGKEVYRLLFHRDTEQWFVEEVWCE